MADAADPADAAQRGSLTIRDRVVSRIACAEATSVEGVRTDEQSRRGRVRTRSLPHAFAVVDDSTAAVAIDIATDWPAPLPRLVRTTQARIAERIRTLTGLEPTRVDVTVDRIVPQAAVRRSAQHHDAPPPGRVR